MTDSDHKTISIVLVVPKECDYLSGTFDSLRKQTHRDLDIHCVLTDESKEMSGRMRIFAEQDNRIRLTRCLTDSIAVARNSVVGSLRGKYMWFIHAGSRFDNDLCENLYLTAEKFLADMVLCFVHGPGEKECGIVAGEIRLLGEPTYLSLLKKYPACVITVSARFLRTSMLRSKADPLFAEETIYDVCRFSWWSSLSATRGVEAGTLGIDSDPGSGLPHDSSPLRVLDLIEDYRKIEAFIHRRKMKREYHDLLRMKKFGSFSYHFRKIRPEAARLAESMISREDMAFIFDPNNDLPHPVRETLWEFFQFARKG